jgi:hypothetical protein
MLLYLLEVIFLSGQCVCRLWYARCYGRKMILILFLEFASED